MPNEPPTRLRRVLLVEDDAFVVMQTKLLLLAAGFEVVGPATRLSEALELAETEALDAAVLDIHLAGTDVWPAAERLFVRHIGIVLCSGLGSSAVIPEFCKKAIRVEKPYRRQALIDAVNRACFRAN